MKQYNDRLKEIRIDRDMSQEDIAKILKIDRKVYGRYENGINEMPIHHLKTICEFYKISADYILGIKFEK